MVYLAIILAVVVIILIQVVFELMEQRDKARNELTDMLNCYEVCGFPTYEAAIKYMEEHPLVPVWDDDKGLIYKRK